MIYLFRIIITETQAQQTKMPVGAPSRNISDIKMPVKGNGKADKRYKMPQVVKSDGTRDQRTKLMSKR